MSMTGEIREYLRNHPEDLDKTNRELTEYFECHPTLVGRAKKSVTSTKNTPGKKKAPAQQEHPVAISLQLHEVDSAMIQLRNGNGNLIGTLVVDNEGVAYRRPNQKTMPDRKLKWDLMDRLMQVGF